MPERGNLVILVLLLLFAGFGLYLFLDSVDRTPPEDKADAPSAPKQLSLADWRLTDMEGTEVRFKDLQGKIVFINIWATHCAPCLVEMPSIQALYESLAGSDEVTFLIVSTEPMNDVRRMVAKKGWKLPLYVARNLPSALDVSGIPTTFIADRKGEVVYRYEGAKVWNTDGFRDYLKKIP